MLVDQNIWLIQWRIMLPAYHSTTTHGWSEEGKTEKNWIESGDRHKKERAVGEEGGGAL